MTTTKSKTHECSDVRWLKCPDPSFEDLGVEEDRCRICDDTGLRFPGLSESCPDRSSHPPGCFCQGRGRVPVDTLEAWLDAAESLHGGWEMTKTKKGYYFDYGSIGPAPTHLAVIQQAMCFASEQHPEEADDTTST